MDIVDFQDENGTVYFKGFGVALLNALMRMMFYEQVFLTQEYSPDGKGFELTEHRVDHTLALSPYLINLRVPSSGGSRQGHVTDATFDLLAVLIWEIVQHFGLKIDWVCGIPYAGDPIARAMLRVAQLSGRQVGVLDLVKGKGPLDPPVLAAKSAPREQIESRGGRVLLLLDTITRGTTTVLVPDALRRHGFVVEHAIVAVDRTAAASAALARHGVELHSVMQVQDFAEYGKVAGFISRADYNAVVQYRFGVSD